MRYKSKKINVLYKSQLIKIYEIIIDKNIDNKEKEISKICDFDILENTIKHGMYTGIDKELNIIRLWIEDIKQNADSKSNQYSEKTVMNSVCKLVYLNKLYESNSLDENTYYPIFKKLSHSRLLNPPKIGYILSSKLVDFNNDQIKSAINNIDSIEKIIKEFHTGKVLENLKFRRKTEEFLERKNYLENYKYAEFIIKEYINNNEIYKTDEFLNVLKINKDIFNDCINLIKCLNLSLYNEYEKKKELNIKKNFIACIHVFKYLSDTINDYQQKGEDMPVLDFLSVAPFIKTNAYYVNKIYEFISDKQMLNTIVAYLYRNKLNKLHYINVEKYIFDLVSLGDYVFTNEDKERIKIIFRTLNLPCIYAAINGVVNNYINGEYDLSEIKNSNNIKENKTIDKPYQYKIK